MIFKKLFTLFILLCALNMSYADTCPDIKGLDPLHPPAGWTLNVPPIFEEQAYYFGEAIHSLNGSFYYQQVICKYQACASAFCPAFSLLSNKQYVNPKIKSAPWDVSSRIAFTLTCRPPNNDPTSCVFQ
jgi:hypothetical protein